MLRKLRPGKADKDKVETSLIEEFSYPKYGPGQLWETVAERARQKGADIRMGCRVSGLSVEGGRVTGVRYVQNGQESALAADIVISSMPIKDLVLGIPGARRTCGASPRGCLTAISSPWAAGAAAGAQKTRRI